MTLWKIILDEQEVKTKVYDNLKAERQPNFKDQVKTGVVLTKPVCAIKYSPENPDEYEIKQFYEGETFDKGKEGWHVTHHGHCGACSTLQDLAVYLSTDLTNEARKCAVKKQSQIRNGP